MPLQTFESQRRGTRGKRGTFDSSSTSSSVDVEVLHCITCNDHDTLLMITQNGIAFGISAYQVPLGSRTARGTPLPSVLPISMDDIVTTVLPVSEFTQKDDYIVLATKQGWIKRTSLDAFAKTSSRGLVIATLDDGDKLQWCHRCTDYDDILLGSSHGMAVRFPASTLRPTGRTSRGVISMKLKEGDTIADMNVLAPFLIHGDKDDNDDDDDENGNKEFVLCVTEQGYGKRVSTNDFRSTSRGNLGVIAIKFKKQSKKKEEGDEEVLVDDKMSCFCIVKEYDEILVNTSRGIMVRQKVEQIPCQSRSATGVVIQKVDESDIITSVSVLPMTKNDDDDDDDDE
jgi:DNA gyrase subunit A